MQLRLQSSSHPSNAVMLERQDQARASLCLLVLRALCSPGLTLAAVAQCSG